MNSLPDFNNALEPFNMNLENDQTLPRMLHGGENKILEFKIENVTFHCELPIPNKFPFKSKGYKKLNDFTIFRTVLQQHLQSQSDKLKISRIQNVDISSLSGKIWKSGSKAFKDMFKKYAEEVNECRERNSEKSVIIGKMAQPNVASSNIIGTSFINNQIMGPNSSNINDVEVPQMVNCPVEHPTHVSIQAQSQHSLYYNVLPDIIEGINFGNLPNNDINGEKKNFDFSDHFTPISLNEKHAYIPSPSRQTIIPLLDDNCTSGFDIINGISFYDYNYNSYNIDIEYAKHLPTNEVDTINVNSINLQQINDLQQISSMGYINVHSEFSPVSLNDTYAQTTQSLCPPSLLTNHDNSMYELSLLGGGLLGSDSNDLMGLMPDLNFMYPNNPS
ncbi:9661_t:CDS:2 [Dentiscutata heterogama]|uniref:9661_t:CDS:1 n=1 Tax=Dentiscutata heterogama TaxID=1316150 RepID=A0ACA9N815_9GLOM|nr:9661_t:CDS:2 [Dentiscutata heterogama]